MHLVHKHNASAGGKRGEAARAELKKGLIGVTDDDVEDLQEAWQEVCNVCNARDDGRLARTRIPAVRVLDGTVRNYVQQHRRVHRRDRQRQAQRAAEQPKAVKLVDAPALEILDVDGVQAAKRASSAIATDRPTCSQPGFAPAVCRTRRQCYANLRRLGLLTPSGLSCFFTLERT